MTTTMQQCALARTVEFRTFFITINATGFFLTVEFRTLWYNFSSEAAHVNAVMKDTDNFLVTVGDGPAKHLN
jgi:hypothetical protein